MRYEEIETNKIRANKWNPNEMKESIFNHLVEEMQRIGNVQPILVRPSNNHYEIIDGEHRFKAATQLQHTTIPAIIIETKEEEAKITTINMNKIKGEPNPLKFAQLLQELTTDFGQDALSNLTKISTAELEQYKNLLNLPEPDFKDLQEKNLVTIFTCPHCNQEFKANEAEQRKIKE